MRTKEIKVYVSKSGHTCSVFKVSKGSTTHEDFCNATLIVELPEREKLLTENDIVNLLMRGALSNASIDKVVNELFGEE